MGGRRTAEVAQQMSSEENEIAANEEEIELSLETEYVLLYTFLFIHAYHEPLDNKTGTRGTKIAAISKTMMI